MWRDIPCMCCIPSLLSVLMPSSALHRTLHARRHSGYPIAYVTLLWCESVCGATSPLNITYISWNYPQLWGLLGFEDVVCGDDFACLLDGLLTFFDHLFHFILGDDEYGACACDEGVRIIALLAYGVVNDSLAIAIWNGHG